MLMVKQDILTEKNDYSKTIQISNYEQKSSR